MISTSYCERGGRIGEVVELSKKTQKIIAAACGIILVGIVLALAIRHYAPDFSFIMPQTEKNNDSRTTAEKPEETSAETTDKKDADKQPAPTNSYAYTAVAGDSYTLFARNAVQEYAQAHNINLTSAQALQAEITLANNAGSPLLDIGQRVTIEQSAVASALGVESSVATTDDTTASSTSKPSGAAASGDYAHTATTGESYSTIARGAISEYVSKNKLTLSGTQRIAAEATIVASANSPEISIGQVVTISNASIKHAVDAATKLSSAELANWQPYAILAGL